MIQCFVENLWLMWLIVSVVCLTLELTSGDLWMVCIAIGAMVGVLCAVIDFPFWGQVLTAAIASVVCIIFIRPSMVRRLRGKEERNSNADALIGQQGTITTAVPEDGYGYVKIAGDEWRCVSAEQTAIEVGSKVTVVKRESTVLIVSK